MKEKIYRDLIYFNANKVQSILAQINKGLIESFAESEQSSHSTEGSIKTSKALELLGLPISVNGNYNYTKGRDLQQEKSLHDYALTKLLEMVKIIDVSNLDRSSLSHNSDRLFVKVRGELSVYDFESLGHTLENMDNIDSLINTGTTREDVFQKLADFVKNAYSGLITVEIKNKKGISFLGAIENNYFRENTRNMLYKYGSTLKGEWEMICQITMIPSNNKETLEEAFEGFGKSIETDSLKREKTLGNFMNQVLKELSKVNEMFASVSYPNIAVEPIAVYKEINLKV